MSKEEIERLESTFYRCFKYNVELKPLIKEFGFADVKMACEEMFDRWQHGRWANGVPPHHPYGFLKNMLPLSDEDRKLWSPRPPNRQVSQEQIDRRKEAERPKEPMSTETKKHVDKFWQKHFNRPFGQEDDNGNVSM